MLTAITFIILLSILIFVHEFGHFLAARIVGVKVEEFAFGLPFTKPLLSKVYRGIKLSIYPILFGGFVKLLGEEQAASAPVDTGASASQRKQEWNNAFFTKSKLQRTFVILAGVAMNFVLGVLVISYIFTQGVLVPKPGVKISKILKNSPAEKAGLKVNDVILKVDNKKINNPDELINYTKGKLGQEISLTILRKEKGYVLGGGVGPPAGGLPTSTPEPKIKKAVKEQIVEREVLIRIIPRKKYPKDEGPMGVGITNNYGIKKLPFWQAPILGTIEALEMSWQIAREFALMLWRLVTIAQTPKEVAGPIGIVQLTSEAVKFGYLAVLQLLALLSLNLAVINALPFPALDGGRLLFIFVEGIFGRKVKPKIEHFINNVGMAIL